MTGYSNSRSACCSELHCVTSEKLSDVQITSTVFSLAAATGALALCAVTVMDWASPAQGGSQLAFLQDVTVGGLKRKAFSATLTPQGPFL